MFAKRFVDDDDVSSWAVHSLTEFPLNKRALFHFLKWNVIVVFVLVLVKVLQGHRPEMPRFGVSYEIKDLIKKA